MGTAAEQENKMGTQPIGRLLAGMAIPMMISMLVQALYNIVDSIYVAQLSEDALTAVSLAFPLQNLAIAVGVGTGVGMNALLSRSLGEKNRDMVDRSANTGIFLFLCSYVVFAILGVFGSGLFYRVLTDVPVIVDYGTSYATICMGLSLGQFTQFCFERMLQSTGRTGLAMFTHLVGAVTNIILDPIFIFGLWGMPRMEVAGAAVATVIGQSLAGLCAILMNLHFNHEVHLSLRRIRFDREVVPEIYRVGLPSIVMTSIGSVMTFGLNKILIAFSTTATAVLGAYFKLQSFVFMPVFGLNNGMVPIISYNYGAAEPHRVKRTILLANLAAVVIMGLGTLTFECFPAALLGLFDASEEMLRIGIPALRIIAVNFMFAGYCILAGSVCQAIGNPMFSLINSVCRQLVVLLPAAWLLAQTGRLELVWLAFPISEIASVILSTIFLRHSMKKANAVMAAKRAQ